ncbi:MAG: hypothetical protein IJB55_06085 [Firmicutes bacterium]|nr:hypothetical protein [Bacillota bacterium]
MRELWESFGGRPEQEMSGAELLASAAALAILAIWQEEKRLESELAQDMQRGAKWDTLWVLRDAADNAADDAEIWQDGAVWLPPSGMLAGGSGLFDWRPEVSAPGGSVQDIAVLPVESGVYGGASDVWQAVRRDGELPAAGMLSGEQTVVLPKEVGTVEMTVSDGAVAKRGAADESAAAAGVKAGGGDSEDRDDVGAAAVLGLEWAWPGLVDGSGQSVARTSAASAAAGREQRRDKAVVRDGGLLIAGDRVPRDGEAAGNMAENVDIDALSREVAARLSDDLAVLLNSRSWG